MLTQLSRVLSRPTLLLSSLLLSSAVVATTPIASLEQAISNNSLRSAANMARDQYRNPLPTLQFFDVTPQATVVEISPGGGWYTEILAPLLAEQGVYYAAHFPASAEGYGQRSRQAFVEKLSANPAYSKVKLTEFAPRPGIEIAPAGSADVVLTFRNLHNWYMAGGEEAMLTAFAHFYTALKPGGVLGIVEHRLPETQLDTDWTRSGYMPESLTIKLAEQAGFTLEARSEINANPKDTADHPGGVWTLPPTLRLGEQDRDKYLAIGESDRMTLKFRKPATP